MTTKELKEKLVNDPEFRARRQKQLEEIWAIRKKDQEQLVLQIRDCGYDIESVYDLVNNAPHPVLKRKFIGPYERAYPILVMHLDLPHERIIREGIIRALTVKDGGTIVEEALLRHFGSETDVSTKWVLANALSVAMPYHRRKKHPEIRATLRPSKDTEQAGRGDGDKPPN